MKTFGENLQTIITSSRTKGRPLAEGECQSTKGGRCSLCHAVELEYAEEIQLKNRALRSFWEQYAPPKLLAPLIPSPLGREYRTVTKRRAFPYRDSVRLGLIAPANEGAYKPFDVVRCAIEPAAQAPIYQKVQELLDKPYAKPLAETLSYVILKGSYTEYSLILSVREMSPDVVHATNTLSKSLTHSFNEIVGIFLYEDTSDGRYYLGASKRHPTTFRKVFGKAEIYQRICGRSFLYSPLSFSQINLSIVDLFVTKARELLDIKRQTRLFDLYCGYGLFALCLAENSESVIGVEMAADSIASAIANAKRQKVLNTRFIRSDITVETVPRLMKSARQQDVVLLDPPRSGTGVGVIECIGARKPVRVLHIFCNIDIMPAELKRWDASGYTISTAVPFDMFPGTSSVEMMVLLTRR